LQELAALLSGGSSKEFDSDDDTGRFGTGFLVTHVLAERTRLRGLLQMETGCERFDLTLDRGGTEDTILANIKESQDAIRAAVPVSDPARMPSATFEYACDEGDSWAHGLKELKRALPYLYATREELGSVKLQDGNTETWIPSEVERMPIEDGDLVRRSISVTRGSSPPRELCIYRFSVTDASAVALVLVEHTEDGLKVCLPETNAPRVFREYPLRDSGFLPINLILNGKFDLDQERRRLLMSDKDKRLLEQALSAAVLAVRYAIDHRWEDAHWLAVAERPTDVFEGSNPEETGWWKEHLAQVAGRIARSPVVDSETGFLPAVTDEGTSADFIIPRLLDADGSDETTVERLWPLVAVTETLVPPRRELAPDWTRIAEGWSSLGVQIRRISVAKLAESACGDAQTLEQLRVQGDSHEWVAIFLDIVGECWSKRTGTDLSALEGMIPNQNLRLCSPADLMRDEGVSKRLKDICAGMGYDIRDRLLLRGFDEIAQARELSNVTETIKVAVPRGIAEDEVVSKVVKQMSDRLPEGEPCDANTLDVQRATVYLLAHLWDSLSTDAVSVAQRIPLVASNGRAVRWSVNRLFMGPIRAWPELARPFADAYPPNRVLDDLYAGSEADNVPNVASALSEWGIALTDPVTQDTVAELKGRRLEALSGVDATGVVVRREQLSQIALLQSGVLQRCQEDIERARMLFGLVLCYVARRDSGWKERRNALGRRAGEDIPIPIGGALWLADLKVRAWVPLPGEDGKPQGKVFASAATLKELLNPSWLRDNDDAIRLLSEGFDFDQLELRLLGITESDQERQELRDSLAGLLETGGADPGLYTDLATEVQARQQRKRNVERCRNLGLGVQNAIGTALEREGLLVELVDEGFDYKVALRNGDVLEDVGIPFRVGPYLVEVKATTTGQARLTPLQAKTAWKEPERYVLCVVDLRQVSEVDLAREWTAERVEPLARLVPDIGSRVGETYEWVDEARTFDVGIRNESALRYEVPPKIWEGEEFGRSIGDWVKTIKARSATVRSL